MRAIMLAIVCLCAYFAAGQDADPAFCDAVDGIISEVSGYDRGDTTKQHLDVTRYEYSVGRVTQPTKLPGAANCGAYVYGLRSSRTIRYTCQWTGTSPRSTFVNFGTQLHPCLAKRGYSASSPVDGEGPLIAGSRTTDHEDRFTHVWKTGQGLNQLYLVAYKVGTKGVFLQIRFFDRSYDDKRRRIRNWVREHERAKRNYRKCLRSTDCTASEEMGEYIYSDDNPYRDAYGEPAPELEAVGELWAKSGRNAGELP